MKKLLLTIFAFATILALTIIPASAATISQPITLDESGETWYQFVDNATNKTTYFKFEYDGAKIEEGTQVLIWGFDKDAGSADEQLIAGIGSDSGKPLFEQLNKVFILGFLPPSASEFDIPVKVYVQNDNVNKLFYLDAASAAEAEGEVHFYDFTNESKESDIKLTAPDGNEYSFSTMTTNYETNYLFLSPNKPSPPQEKSGSMFLSEPVWIVIIVALMAICFAGGTAFGVKKNKTTKAE